MTGQHHARGRLPGRLRPAGSRSSSRRLNARHPPQAREHQDLAPHPQPECYAPALPAAIQAHAAQAAALRRFNDDLESLKSKFIGLQTETDIHPRGYAFESLLADIFLLYDLEPRLAYTTPGEQIDGSFTFDTDDYIVEARWRSAPSGRGDADIFASKVRRKGKNAVGLFTSVNGFTEPFKEAYKESTPFVAMDGADLRRP